MLAGFWESFGMRLSEALRLVERMLAEHRLCDSCLGRQFAALGYGLSNRERGEALKISLLLEACLKAERGDRKALETVRTLAVNGGLKAAEQTLEKLGLKPEVERKACEICEDRLSEVEKLGRMAVEELEPYEYESFLVGAKIPARIVEAEDELRGRCSISWGENIKGEFTREVGKVIAKLTGKHVEFKNPDVIVTISPYSSQRRVTVKANPLFIEGRYRKLVSGIPQARWLCGKCRGKGCEACNWTGKKYPESVQEIVEKPFLAQTLGDEADFHAGGREDIDAKVLGTGRPFVIEIKNPRRRTLDLPKIAEEINSSGKVEVEGLEITGKEAVARVKAAEAYTKTYQITVEADKPVTLKELKRLEEFFTGRKISQWTPRRVLHRRADKERVKTVYRVEAKRVSRKRFEASVKCQGGLYVKELVDGDEGRTKPSMAELLGKKLKCISLTVLKVEEEKGRRRP
ncbi:MAG: pseudouridylate synthase [Candidatus Hecatellales archaeon B24]|nr:MAG: pseudouridylate synthase [Candidatus Hecatellales archaeon B24]